MKNAKLYLYFKINVEENFIIFHMNLALLKKHIDPLYIT